MKRIVLFFIGLLLIFTGLAYAVEDGFGSAQKIEGEHFIIYYAPDVYPSALSQQLDLTAADEILSGKNTGQEPYSGASLAGMVDTLFLRVCEILDMPLYSFQGTIKVCRDQGRLKKIYYNLFGKDLPVPSFYVLTFNTIYICPEGFKREILGHEMAHAIMSRYFVVSPSVKIQEVLSMYVEYQLRKQ